MQLQIHNSLSGQKEAFKPMDPSNVRIYVCGPTVYNYVHIGNARPAVVFDAFVRLLRHLYPQVVYARNITDIDDKINHAAAAAGVDISQITQTYIEAYHQDMGALGVLPPDLEPKATDHLPEIIDLVERLIERGHAYESESHVLFAVDSMQDYGKLSKRKLDDMIAGARVEVASYKRNPLDFVLWKPSTDDLPGWNSPWGRGRPGWHIECTAMINRHLGATIDIHGGGHDLTFPHHENEIAQGTCAHEHPENYVNYWMHNGMITVEGEKMSKSLGNFITARELLQDYPAEQLRLALLSAQYRSSLNWSNQLLEQSKQSLDRFYGVLRDAGQVSQGQIDPEFLSALCDDFNSPQAIAQLHQLASAFYRSQDEQQKQQLAANLKASAQLLGLLDQQPNQWFQQEQQGKISTTQIEQLIADRATAKANREFAKADAIRQQLLDQGVVLEDSRDGTRWHWQ